MMLSILKKVLFSAGSPHTEKEKLAGRTCQLSWWDLEKLKLLV